MRASQQSDTADAEIRDPSLENPELKDSPFKTWSRSEHSPACFAYRQECLPCQFLSSWSIHLHFFPKSLPSFSCVSCAAGPQNKIGHLAHRHRPLMQVPVLSARDTLQNVTVLLCIVKVCFFPPRYNCG